MYCEYAETISKLEKSPQIIVADYAELLESPQALVQRMFDAAGLPSAEGAVAYAAIWVRPQTGRQSWDAFSPAELALVWGLTSETRRKLGYGHAYYVPKGLTRQPSASDYCVESNAVHVLYGLSATGNKDDFWVADTGRIAVESLPECKRVTLKFWANFPTAILPEGSIATLSILAGDPERLIAKEEIAGGKARLFEVAVNLWDIAPLLQAKNGAVRVLTLASSHSYKSVNLPAQDTADGIGTADSRRVSVIMRAPEFE